MVTSQSLNTSQVRITTLLTTRVKICFQDKAAHQTNRMSNKTPVTYKTPKNPSPHGYKFKGVELPVSSDFPEFRSNKQVSERSQILIDCLFRQENRLEKIKLLHYLTAHISEIEAKVKKLELQKQASTARESLIKEFQTERSSSQVLGEGTLVCSSPRTIEPQGSSADASPFPAGVPASNLFTNPASAKGVSANPHRLSLQTKKTIREDQSGASEIEAFKRVRVLVSFSDGLFFSSLFPKIIRSSTLLFLAGPPCRYGPRPRLGLQRGNPRRYGGVGAPEGSRFPRPDSCFWQHEEKEVGHRAGVALVFWRCPAGAAPGPIETTTGQRCANGVGPAKSKPAHMVSRGKLCNLKTYPTV